MTRGRRLTTFDLFLLTFLLTACALVHSPSLSPSFPLSLAFWFQFECRFCSWFVFSDQLNRFNNTSIKIRKFSAVKFGNFTMHNFNICSSWMQFAINNSKSSPSCVKRCVYAIFVVWELHSKHSRLRAKGYSQHFLAIIKHKFLIKMLAAQICYSVKCDAIDDALKLDVKWGKCGNYFKFNSYFISLC